MKTNSLIVKDTGIHVSDGEVEVICQDQEAAMELIYNTFKLKHSPGEPYSFRISNESGNTFLHWNKKGMPYSSFIDVDHPYPIPNLRFEVNCVALGNCRCIAGTKCKKPVAILSVEEETKESQEEPSFYKLIASLVTTYQMSPEDWDLGPMSKQNWREVSKRIADHNDSLKNLAVELKHKFESITRK